MATAPSPSPSSAALRRACAALTIRPEHLVCLVLCVVAFSGWLLAAGGGPASGAGAFFVVLVLSAYHLGRLILRACPVEAGLADSFPTIFLVGSLAWALLLLGTHSCLPGPLRWHVLLLFAAAAVGQFAIHGRTIPPREDRGRPWTDPVVVAFGLAAATLWARGLLQPPQAIGDDVLFRHWLDYFDHASFTSQFLSAEHLWRFGNKELSHMPTPLYHYGSYLFPAGLAACGGLGAYDAVVAFWTPFGTFLVGLAAFSLAAAWAGRTGGTLAVIAVLALPDASSYGLRNGWFGYHWLQQIGSAGMYGVASATAALLFLLAARRNRAWTSLAAAFAFGCGTFLFKAQVCVVVAPLLAAWFVLCHPRFAPWRRGVLLLALVALALGGIVAANHLHLGPRIEASREFFRNYGGFVAAQSAPGFLRWAVEGGTGGTIRDVAIVGLVVLATFGALAGVLPLLSVWAWRRGKLQAADLVPWLAVAVYVLVLVGLNDGTIWVHPWELLHRPFVWTYFVVLTWCAGKSCVLFGDTRPGRWLLDPWMLTVCGSLALLVPWSQGLQVQEGPAFLRERCCNGRFPRGLVDCGRHVARHGSRSDVVQDSRCDACLVFGSLAERRSYLARPDLWRKARDRAVPPEIDRRATLVEQLNVAPTAERIRALADATGIRWYLVHPDDRVAWPDDVVDAPAFTSGGFAVYDLTQVRARPADPAGATAPDG